MVNWSTMWLFCDINHKFMTVVLVLLLLPVVPLGSTKSKNVDLFSAPKKVLQSSDLIPSSFFAFDLMHPHHIDLPFAQPNLTWLEMIGLSLKSSEDRMNYLAYHVYENPQFFGKQHDEKHENHYFTSITHIVGQYLARIFISNNPRPFLVLMDTGSEITWLRCNGSDANPIKYTGPIYNPKESDTVKFVQPEDPLIKDNPRFKGLFPRDDPRKEVSIHKKLVYGDKFSRGTMLYETFNLIRMEPRELYSFPNIIFMCATDTRGRFGHATGILGLSSGKLGLLSQMNIHVFSYCLVPLINARTRSSILYFNSSGNIPSHEYTPLYKYPHTTDNVHAKLLGITINNIPIRLHLDDGEEGLVMRIDSGSPLTCFETRAFNSLTEHFDLHFNQKRYVGPLPHERGLEGKLHCYDIKGVTTPSFPKMAFQFKNLNVALSPENIFLNIIADEIICLSFLPKEHMHVPNVIGSAQMGNFQITFDNLENRLGISPRIC